MKSFMEQSTYAINALVKANKEAAERSPQETSWSKGVACGLEQALEIITALQPAPPSASETPFPLSEDISLAYEWCNASKVFESPGNGEGWRHTCLRLAQEVERQQKELAAERAESDRLRKNIGCARNQGTTQFCHEAVDAKAEAERLRAELKGTMHAGGYDYFSGLLKQMDEVAHNARYVAEQEKARAEDGERQLKLLSSELAIRCSNLDRLHDELAIRDTEMQVQADLANKHFAELTRLRAVVDRANEQLTHLFATFGAEMHSCRRDAVLELISECQAHRGAAADGIAQR